MAAHENTHIPANEQIRLDSRAAGLMTKAAIVGGIGLLLSLALSFLSNDGFRRFWFSYLAAFVYFLTIALGALAFVLLQYATRSGWSVTVRRTAENIAATLPIFAVLSLPIIITVISHSGSLYRWAVPSADKVVEKHEPAAAHAAVHEGTEAAGAQAHGEAAGAMKEAEVVPRYVIEAEDQKPIKNGAYLNPWFFLLRLAIYFVAWSCIALYFRQQSILQDQTGDIQITLRLQSLSNPMLIILALTITFSAFDLLMSLDPHWFSTMFGVYIIAGSFVSSFAMLIVTIKTLQHFGYLREAINREHFQDLGKYLFGFVFFWGYIAFSQYMLLWYANIPEETTYLARHGMTTVMSGGHLQGWTIFAIVLLLGHLLIPFPALLSRHVKRNNVTLLFWSWWMLVFHYVDMYWIVMPELSFKRPPMGPGFFGVLVDLCALVGIGGLFVAALIRVASRGNLRPTADPRLPQALAFQNV